MINKKSIFRKNPLYRDAVELWDYNNIRGSSLTIIAPRQSIVHQS